jgi:hypothetical protein
VKHPCILIGFPPKVVCSGLQIVARMPQAAEANFLLTTIPFVLRADYICGNVYYHSVQNRPDFISASRFLSINVNIKKKTIIFPVV